MNAFAGFVVFGECSIEQGLTTRLSSIIRRRGEGRPRVMRSSRAIIVQCGPPPSETSPSAPGALFAASARLHNDSDLAVRRNEAHGSIVCRQFERRGDEGLAQLLGAFAFAHWNESDGELTLGRDCNGERPLFFHVGDGFAAFASYLPDLLALPNVPRQLDETMIAHFLALNHREYERSFYVGVDRVPTRTRVTITRDDVRMRRYWSPRLDAAAPCRTDEDYVERGRELFDRAVARCLKDTPRVSILTSGGLDSSAVAATAARLGQGDATCYTGVPPEGFSGHFAASRYLDERPKVEALARLHPSLQMRYIAPTGVHPSQQDGALLFAKLGLPMRNPSNMGWFGGIEDAIRQDGHQVTLNGAKGNVGLTWGGPNLLKALAAKGRFGRLWREARAVGLRQNRPLWKVLASELLQAAPLVVQDLQLRSHGQSPGDVSRYSLLRADAVEALDLKRQWREAGFDPWYRPRGGSVRLRARQAFDQLQAMGDVQAMSPIWRGTETRDPHADRELMEFCLSVPEEHYQRGGLDRWFGRQVFADRLPPEILNERRRGLQAPNWFEALSANKAGFAAEIERLEASTLGARLIDLPRLKRLCAEWPSSADEAGTRASEYRLGLSRAVHVGQFIRWVEGGNG